MKKNNLIFLFVIILSLESYAQSMLKGRITDGGTNPLPGVNIYIYELNKGTVTGTDGRYLIENIPDGKFRIQYSFIGYSSEVKTIIFNGELETIDVEMHETAIETKEVVISGGYNATQHENAVNIERLKLGASTNILSPNTSELLTQVPGVDMISKGPGVAKPVIRGLSMDNVLVLNDGVRNENYQYSDHHPLGMDEFGIEDVEIIKGPASLLYGPDAIGGVVNFIREKPAPVGHIQGDYNLQFFSNTMGLSTNLGLKGTSRNFFGSVRAGLKSNEDFLQGGGEFVPNSRFNTVSFKAEGGYTGKKAVSKLYYEFNRQKLGLTEEEAVAEVTNRGRKNSVWYEEMNNHLVSSQNKIFLTNYKLDLNLSLQSVDLYHYAGTGETEISMRLSTLSYETRLTLPSTEKSEYIIGAQGFSQWNRNIPGAEEILLPNSNTNNIGFFTLIQYYFSHGFKLQGGVRYDYKSIVTVAVGNPDDPDYRSALDRNFGSFSGSIGATYELADKLFFRANFAAAYRTPNLAELTSNGMHETRYEVGDSGLDPQRAYESDVSIHYHIKNLTLDIAGFYNLIDQYIFIAPTGDTIPGGERIYRYTQSDAVLFGGEAGFHFHPEQLNWLHIEGTYATVTGKQANDDHLPFIPAGKLKFELKFEKEELGPLTDVFIKAGTTTAFAQNHPSPDEESTGAYTLLDAGIGFSIPIREQQMTIGFSVNNLLDKKYIDHLSTLKEVGFYDPGRNFAIAVKLPFRIL